MLLSWTGGGLCGNGAVSNGGEGDQRERGYCSSLPLCFPSFSSAVFLYSLSSLFLLLFLNLLYPVFLPLSLRLVLSFSLFLFFSSSPLFPGAAEGDDLDVSRLTPRIAEDGLL